MPVRASAWLDESGAWAYLPVSAMRSVLVIGRDGGPGFLRAELAHAERVLDVATKTLGRLLRTGTDRNAPTELTSYLAIPEPA
jgi:hypothetical protein